MIPRKLNQKERALLKQFGARLAETTEEDYQAEKTRQTRQMIGLLVLILTLTAGVLLSIVYWHQLSEFLANL